MNALQKIFLSILITCGVSALLAISFTAFDYNFWNVFFVAIIFHFIGFGLINYFTGVVAAYKLRQINAQEILAMRSQSTGVMCAKCNEGSIVPVVVGSDDNEYVCEACGSKNKIIVTAETVLPTLPVLTEKLDPDDLIKTQIKKLDEQV